MLHHVLPNVHSLCDVGCGSGESALEFARRGLEVHAVDLSPVFCEMVRARARQAGLKVEVHCQDMRDFTLPHPVDLVVAEFASLNNLADRRDLSRVLEAAARALAAGGWIYFDVNTPLSLRTQYPETFWVEDAKFKLAQHGRLEPDRRRARLDFEWLLPSGRLWRHVRETLWHVCWTDAEIRRALRLAGFISCGVPTVSTCVRARPETNAGQMRTVARKRTGGRTAARRLARCSHRMVGRDPHDCPRDARRHHASQREAERPEAPRGAAPRSARGSCAGTTKTRWPAWRSVRPAQANRLSGSLETPDLRSPASVSRFHPALFWATTLRSLLPRERVLRVASHAKGVHRSGAAAKVDD